MTTVYVNCEACRRAAGDAPVYCLGSPSALLRLVGRPQFRAVCPRCRAEFVYFWPDEVRAAEPAGGGN